MGKTKKQVKKSSPEEVWPKSFETFRHIGSWEIRSLTQESPSAFNREVRFRKYKVTIEPVDEPIEVYQQRLQKLWDTCDNHHNWKPIENAAKSVGLTLEFPAGTKRNKNG